MDPTPQQISAMADELSALAKCLETSTDPSAIKETKAAVVMKAKSLIGQVQNPMDAAMDHVTNVSLFQKIPTWSISDIFALRYLWYRLLVHSWKSVYSKPFHRTEA